MSKKLLNKLLSAVLVLAICSASLFGCVITVNAEGTYNGTYTVSVGDENHHVALMSKYINARVTFNLDAGMGYGYFSIAKSNGQGGDYAAVSVKPVSATLLDGGSIDAQELNANKENYFTETENPDADSLKGIIFDPGSDQYFTSLTFDMTFEVGSSWYVERNKQYSVTLNVADNDIATKWDNAETHFDLSATENGNYHVHMVNWQDIPAEVATAADDHYTMVDAACGVCGQTVKQVFANPYDDSTLTPKSGPWGHLLANGVTVNYDNNGSLSINVHGRFLYGSEQYVMVCDAAGNKIIDSKSGATKYSGSVALSQSALAGTALHADNDDYIKTYTIGGLSARDIDTDLYITLAVKFNTEIQFSNTIKFSLKDYALSVIDGNGVVYPESVTEAEKTADKEVAASLLYYSASIDESVFTPGVVQDNTVKGNTSVTPVEKTSDTWRQDKNLPVEAPYWSFGDPNMEGEGTEEKPYLIKTSEQLAAIALWGGNSTAGKYYKVDDSVGILYLCPNTDSFDASSLDALKTSLGADKDSNGTTIKKWASNSNYAFQGHFDGNGVIIRGMAAVGSNTQSGLFPYVRGDVSFKNVTVTDSYITSNYGAGAIVGGTTDWSDINSISFENCKVTNCYIENTKVSDTAPTGTDRMYYANAGLAGNLSSVQSSFIVNNCLVNANKYSVSGQQTSYAFVGFIQQNNITISISNSLADATASLTQHGYFINNESNYSNVYTLSPIDENAKNGNGTFAPTESQMKVVTLEQITGAAAKTNMPGLNWTKTWLLTNATPELRLFHSLQTVYIDDLSHTLKCAISVDGTLCSVCGLEEPHAESGTCDCGYDVVRSINISEMLTNKFGADASAKTIEILNANATYATYFVSNSQFALKYEKDRQPQPADSNFEFFATSLNLKTTPHIAFTFALYNEYRNNPSSVNIKFECDGGTVVQITGDQMIHNSGAGRYFAYRLKELPVTKLCKQVNVTVNGNDYGSYSAAGFALAAMGYGSGYEYYAQAAKALVLYSEMVAARYGA